MTEKRFTFDKYSNLYDNELDACYGIGNSKEAETLCDMLNALHEETQRLRKCINEIYLISSRESVE